MSRRRRRAASPDSLELLLDTICNTFGSVLFLAILIAVLIQTSESRSMPAVSQPVSRAAELRIADEQITEAVSRRRTLLHLVESQRKFIDEFADRDVQAALQELQELEADKTQSLEAGEKAAHELAQFEAMIERLTEELTRLDADLAAAEVRERSLAEEITQEVALRVQSIRLPKLRPTGKSEIGMICRYGRLYVWHAYDALGRRVGLNLEDMVALGEQDGILEAAPKPFAGAKIDDRSAVERQLRQFSPRSDYVAVIVYPDSFGRFAELKSIFIQEGFEYRLMPTVPGNEIVDRGGADGMVQ